MLATISDAGQFGCVAPSDRIRVRRVPKRGSYERQVIDEILAEGLICHVGFAVDGQPFVIPMSFAPFDGDLILHGSVVSRLMKTLGEGVPACVSVTHLDGVVLARSTFHHSMNYRSVVAFGTARLIEDETERAAALEALVEHLVPGRSSDARGPNERENMATAVLRFEIEEASAKVRTGPPVDDDDDLDQPVWAGVVPLELKPGTPEAAPDLPADIAQPDYVTGYRRPRPS